jgi:hypothetical protein
MVSTGTQTRLLGREATARRMCRNGMNAARPRIIFELRAGLYRLREREKYEKERERESGRVLVLDASRGPRVWGLYTVCWDSTF